MNKETQSSWVMSLLSAHWSWLTKQHQQIFLRGVGLNEQNKDVPSWLTKPHQLPVWLSWPLFLVGYVFCGVFLLGVIVALLKGLTEVLPTVGNFLVAVGVLVYSGVASVDQSFAERPVSFLLWIVIFLLVFLYVKMESLRGEIQEIIQGSSEVNKEILKRLDQNRESSEEKLQELKEAIEDLRDDLDSRTG